MLHEEAPLGLEPRTSGLIVQVDVLLHDHLKEQSQRLPPPKGTASHPRRGRGTGDLVASLGLTTKVKSYSPHPSMLEGLLSFGH